MASMGYIYTAWENSQHFVTPLVRFPHEITSEGALAWISSDYFQAKGAFHLSELASRTSQLANTICIF